VTWQPPTNNGGSRITGYVVQPFLGNVAQPVHILNSANTTAYIAGLQDTKFYRFEIAAKNAIGTGAFSTMANGMTAGAPGQPGQPTATRTAPGSLRLTFRAPMSDGAPATYYATCTSTNHGTAKTTKATQSPITVAGLTSGKTYTCTIIATNSRGAGPRSNPTPPTTA
jgi:hypothetical protein